MQLIKNWRTYKKLWAAVAGAVVYFLGQYFGVDSQWYSVAVWAFTATGVYQVTNE